MSVDPALPKRRWRQFVVVVSAVVLLGLAWWFWPGEDRRFVGTWDWYEQVDGQEETVSSLELWASGWGIRRSRYSREYADSLQWRVDRDRFEIWDQRSEIADRPTRSLEDRTKLLIYRAGYGSKDYAWRVEKVSPGAIWMRRLPGQAKTPTVLRRVEK